MTATTETGSTKPESAMKVGLMVPANNTTMERELKAWLPEGSTVTTVKIPRGEGMLTRDTIPAYRDRAIALDGVGAIGADVDEVVDRVDGARDQAEDRGRREPATRDDEV